MINMNLKHILFLDFNMVHPFRVGTHPSNHETIPLFEVSTPSHKLDPSISDISEKNYVSRSLTLPELHKTTELASLYAILQY